MACQKPIQGGKQCGEGTGERGLVDRGSTDVEPVAGLVGGAPGGNQPGERVGNVPTCGVSNPQTSFILIALSKNDEKKTLPPLHKISNQQYYKFYPYACV